MCNNYCWSVVINFKTKRFNLRQLYCRIIYNIILYILTPVGGTHRGIAHLVCVTHNRTRLFSRTVVLGHFFRMIYTL